MTSEHSSSSIPHVPDRSARLSTAARAGAGLVAIALLAPSAALLGVLTLASLGAQAAPTVLVGLLALGAALGIVVAFGWGVGHLSVPATLAYLTLGAVLSVVLPWLMLTSLGER